MHLFLHIGDHKTGSTSIQAFLRRRAADLEAVGIYVPTAGTYSPESGHHQLAFELLEDKRWNPAHGGLEELVQELRRCPLPRAVISCEDLSLLVVRPDRLRRLEACLLAEGHTVSWLMFLRRVDDYLESLYCELKRSGLRARLGYPGFALPFLLWGRRYSKFCDQRAFVRRWRGLSDSPLQLLDYDRAVGAEGLLPRFLQAIGAPPSLVEANHAAPVLNQRRELITRHFRSVLGPLLMARFHRSNQRALHS
ncbi:hypothetical protein [Aphanothece minutissima]|uniref:Uncharacterized protein n=1 Tax=Aphanothece cf. minutissima CCALA 015 TaxID=2107695 RepID=A0ABX5F903_9CHRO|nr:hypothetical protein [Aphanothece minutissima]PSB38215.1 hypothetical protein C7B81_05800 [Aphanothece cf. minutissima CCALA 015]